MIILKLLHGGDIIKYFFNNIMKIVYCFFVLWYHFCMKLYDELIKYSKKKIVSMHMPGHKGNKFGMSNILPYKLDITEIDGFDNLHNPKEILLDCENKLTKMYGAYKSFYLINGSTSGILSSIKYFCDIGDKIITTRNCHKSVYHTIEFLNLKTAFINSKVDKNGIVQNILPQDLQDVLENNKDAKCILITSPTYEGVISDIKSLSNVAHKYNIPLIVDAAHGAHLFLEQKNAIALGADVEISSLHKTLPSLTQTAALHINSKIDVNKMQHAISLFMTSSPSYILMASIDECVEFLINFGEKYYKKLQKNINLFAKKCKILNNITILNNDSKNYYDYDPSKIVIMANGNGKKIMEELRKNNIEAEMVSSNYALAYATMFNTKKDFDRLFEVLKQVDATIKNKTLTNESQRIASSYKLSIHDALAGNHSQSKLENATEKICGEYVWVYPPGIPVLIPGEVISREKIDYIKDVYNKNFEILSTNNDIPDKITIVKLDK